MPFGLFLFSSTIFLKSPDHCLFKQVLYELFLELYTSWSICNFIVLIVLSSLLNPVFVTLFHQKSKE